MRREEWSALVDEVRERRLSASLATTLASVIWAMRKCLRQNSSTCGLNSVVRSSMDGNCKSRDVSWRCPPIPLRLLVVFCGFRGWLS